MKYYRASIFIFVLSLCVGVKLLIEEKYPSTSDLYPDFAPGKAGFQAESLKRYSLGFDHLIADIIWLNILQRDIPKSIQKAKVSWEYTQFNAIVHLDPNFESAYRLGAISLSVFRRDKLGAKLLLEKWVKRRPNYWLTNYLLGYHLYLEMGRYHEAHRYIVKAASLSNSPQWLNSLGVRLLSETGALMQALKLSTELYEKFENPITRGELTQRIRSLNYHIQKAAWRTALEDYRKQRKKEPGNIRELQPLVGGQFRELAAMNLTEGLPSELITLLSVNHHFYYNRNNKSIESVKSLEELDIPQLGIYHSQQKQESKDGI